MERTQKHTVKVAGPRRQYIISSKKRKKEADLIVFYVINSYCNVPYLIILNSITILKSQQITNSNPLRVKYRKSEIKYQNLKMVTAVIDPECRIKEVHIEGLVSLCIACLSIYIVLYHLKEGHC